MDNVAIPQQFRQQRPMPATTNAEKRFTAYVRCQTPEHYEPTEQIVNNV